MKSIGFLLYGNFEELDLVGPWEMLTMWRDYAKGPECFTVAEKAQTVQAKKGMRFIADYDFTNVPEFDVLVIPGGQGSTAVINNSSIMNFIKDFSKQKNKQILAVCTGVSILYAAGLLKDRNITTHHLRSEQYEATNDVKFISSRYQKDGNIWTSAGVSAGMDMALAFIADIAGDAVAGKVQNLAEYYPDNKIYLNDEVVLPKYVSDLN
ncbi:DJ-1/PfpI family protein [Thiotrichales bacterium 19S11-10]|nr:DJ-1/PfpI family protein [Thiotrichales bacterium 19S11-10]